MASSGHKFSRLRDKHRLLGVKKIEREVETDRIVEKHWGLNKDFGGFSVQCKEGSVAFLVLIDDPKLFDTGGVELLAKTGLFTDEEIIMLSHSRKYRVITVAFI